MGTVVLCLVPSSVTRSCTNSALSFLSSPVDPGLAHTGSQ